MEEKDRLSSLIANQPNSPHRVAWRRLLRGYERLDFLEAFAEFQLAPWAKYEYDWASDCGESDPDLLSMMAQWMELSEMTALVRDEDVELLLEKAQWLSGFIGAAESYSRGRFNEVLSRQLDEAISRLHHEVSLDPDDFDSDELEALYDQRDVLAYSVNALVVFRLEPESGRLADIDPIPLLRELDAIDAKFQELHRKVRRIVRATDECAPESFWWRKK